MTDKVINILCRVANTVLAVFVGSMLGLGWSYYETNAAEALGILTIAGRNWWYVINGDVIICGIIAGIFVNKFNFKITKK